MNDVEYQTKNLVSAIKGNNVYHQYQRLLKKLQQQPEVYEKMNEFRRRSFELQCREGDSPLEEINNLQVEYKEILSNTVVEEFLVAEQRLCGMIRNINTSVAEAVDLDIDFLA